MSTNRTTESTRALREFFIFSVPSVLSVVNSFMGSLDGFRRSHGLEARATSDNLRKKPATEDRGPAFCVGSFSSDHFETTLRTELTLSDVLLLSKMLIVCEPSVLKV